jgi:glycosyltransferase involved in cell wall biosynthesis
MVQSQDSYSKIAILAPTFLAYSGIDKVAYQQAAKFKSEGKQVSLFTLQSGMSPPQGVELFVIGMPKSLFGQRFYRLIFPLDIVKMFVWVRRLRHFEVVYSHQYPMNWIAYLTKLFYRVRYIYWNHGYAPPEMFFSFVERCYQRLTIIIANWTIRKADQVYSVSYYLRSQLLKDTGVKSEVLYNHIDTNIFYPGQDEEFVRKKHSIGKGPLILFVGRISPHKGVHLLIGAFKIVQQHFPSAKLLIVGKPTLPTYADNLRKNTDESLIFTEVVPDHELPLYYAACDVYATATLWEGFDLPLAEAQACGKPVVAFDIGPHPEVVKPALPGKLVPVLDVEAFANAILVFLKPTGGL